MKNLYFLVLITFISQAAAGQLVHCRPRICMIDYNYHDDRTSNADMNAIKSALPDILIDNTPGGYWGQRNGGTGCLPSKYTLLGIQVFSYITGGYEGTKKYSDITEDDSASNLARVDQIAKDGATGVFLDEVTSFPDSSGKQYIIKVYDECQKNNLKLILNPGTTNFDSWLMSHCDYLMSDENYNGMRSPTTSENNYLARILVVNQNINNVSSADSFSAGARSNGFGYSYACSAYTSLPTWLNTWLSDITQPPVTPTIAVNGNSLKSDAPTGNQWYEQKSGKIDSATQQTYVPAAKGTYFVIVTLDGCISDTSNTISYITTGMEAGTNNASFRLYPDPAANQITISLNIKPGDNYILNIYSMTGKIVKSKELRQNENTIFTGDLKDGIYTVEVISRAGAEDQILMIQR